MLAFDSSVRERDAWRQRAGNPDAGVPPGRVARRLALGALNPVSWLTALFGVVVALVAGAVAAGVVPGLRWLAVDGPTGILAAIRMGVWAHALAYAAAVACFLLLRAGGRTAARRRAVLWHATIRITDGALTACVVVLVVAGLAFAAAGPRLQPGFLRADDGFGWLPPALRNQVDSARDDVVRDELDALTTCLDDGQAGRWTASYTDGNPQSADDVVTLVADPARAPDQPALAAAALAADNQLAPWVDGLQVRVGDTTVLGIVRKGHAHDQPLTDAAALPDRTFGAPPWLVTAAPLVDRDRVLDCSARTPL
jgi:hypothetical protein